MISSSLQVQRFSLPVVLLVIESCNLGEFSLVAFLLSLPILILILFFPEILKFLSPTIQRFFAYSWESAIFYLEILKILLSAHFSLSNSWVYNSEVLLHSWVCNSEILQYSWICNLEILVFLSAQFKDCHILVRISEILESTIQQFVNSSVPISETLQFFESLQLFRDLPILEWLSAHFLKIQHSRVLKLRDS